MAYGATCLMQSVAEYCQEDSRCNDALESKEVLDLSVVSKTHEEKEDIGCWNIP
jgi:hypothetical protein